MNILIDTHILIWSLVTPEKLSKKEKEILLAPKNFIYVSIISLWEISLKVSLGKLDFRGIRIEDIPEGILSNGFKYLALTEKEALSYCNLNLNESHKDPFDRMLIWQCICNSYYFLTRDSYILSYIDSGLKIAKI